MKNPLSFSQIQALRQVRDDEVSVSRSGTYRFLEGKGLIATGGNRSRRVWRITDAGEIILAVHEEAIRLSEVGA
ncbi:hypothetical protein JUN65_01940 [Gluconacetobacter azotocaptans]|uniref:hypothetical protein n=1 Tax=Gluconacetobacter azotocaptans TaxID=142834 RepID=UPI00195C28B4|nr:hypothetical protein [Gluconacetobacter azotocaptans]MBM9400354.1 hypothetical protein [Gluconacetobacter azotocaptans]